MLQLIARQYLSGFRGNEENRGKRVMTVFWILYFLFGLPAISGFYESPADVGAFLSLGLPVAWCMTEAAFCPIRMSKLLFLCPMDVAMRRRYIRGTYWFRVILHTGLCAVGAVISAAFGNDWPGVLCAAFNTTLCALFSVGVDELLFSAKSNEDYDMDNMGRNVVRTFGIILVVIIQLIYVSVAESGGMMEQKRWEQILIGCMEAVALLFAARYVKYWSAMQEEAMHVCSRDVGGKP